MKKHLIAAAVTASFAVPAAAQVTVYGVIDTSYSANEAKFIAGGTSTKVTDTGADGQLSGSRIGFRASEDIGGGLKADAVYEVAVSQTESAANLTTRQGFVGISGGFGSIRAGLQNSATKVIYDTFSANSGAGFNLGHVSRALTKEAGGEVGMSDASTSTSNDVDSSDALRVSNAIMYMTPTMNGFSASLAYAKNKTDKSASAVKNQAQDLTEVGVNYSAGPFAFSYARVDNKTTQETGFTAVSENMLEAGDTLDTKTDSFGLSMKLGAATLLAMYKNEEAKFYDLSGTSETATEREVWTIGARVAMGATTFLASISDGELEQGAANKFDLAGYQVGATYGMSKRTTAYALYGKDEVKTALGGTTGGKQEQKGFVIGLRHTF